MLVVVAVREGQAREGGEKAEVRLQHIEIEGATQHLEVCQLREAWHSQHQGQRDFAIQCTARVPVFIRLEGAQRGERRDGGAGARLTRLNRAALPPFTVILCFSNVLCRCFTGPP